jgi:hypothetical protein
MSSTQKSTTDYGPTRTRGQAPRGESQYVPRPRSERPRCLPFQFHDLRPIKDGGSGQKHKIRDAKLADWTELRCKVGWDKTVAEVAHYGHWNINTARKYERILKQRKLFTVEEGDRRFDHYFGRDGRLKICQRVKRTPHLEELRHVARAPVKSYQSQRAKSYQYKVPPETSKSLEPARTPSGVFVGFSRSSMGALTQTGAPPDLTEPQGWETRAAYLRGQHGS